MSVIVKWAIITDTWTEVDWKNFLKSSLDISAVLLSVYTILYLVVNVTKCTTPSQQLVGPFLLCMKNNFLIVLHQ